MRSLASIAAIICCVSASLGSSTSRADEPLPRSVLVVDQFELASRGATTLLSSFLATLRSNSPTPISTYVEDLDLGRFRGSRFKAALQTYFQEKYHDKPIGIVVAVGSAALELVLELRPQLWHDAPVIFAAVDEGIADRLILPSNVTGTIMPVPLSDPVSVARAIVPGLKRLAIVGDPPERQFIRRQVAQQLESIAKEFELIDLTRLPMRDLKRRVASLPSDSAIIYIGLTLDADNVAYTSYEALAALAEIANRPIVVQADTNIGTGAVGGIVAKFDLMGHDAARLALRVFAGEPASTIPVTAGSAMQPVFDWRQLQRWNISEEQLPPGSEVRFRSLSVWTQYRWYIVLAAAFCALQAVIIAALLANRRKLRREHAERQRAEQAAHDLSGRLITAHEEERSRLARELHDDVTQRLALLAIDAGREERKSSNPESAMRTMREGLVRLSEDVHALSYRLHPSILSDLGLIEALKAECDRFSRTCSIHFEANPEDIPDKLPDDTALCVFRIAQEALRNIARHARATRVEVDLQLQDHALQLVVRDDGAGFDPRHRRSTTSLGHASMRQRAFFLGGRVDILSSPGQGTTIRAWVPLKGEKSEPSTRAVG